MNTRQRLAVLLSILLSSCTGQTLPVVPTGVGHTATVVSSSVATSEPALFPTATPQATEVSPLNTPAPATETPPALAPALGGLGSTSTAIDISAAFIPDTGQSSQPAEPEKKKKKDQEYTPPISGDTGFFLVPTTGFARGIRSVVGPQPSHLSYRATDVTLEIPGLGIDIPIVGIPRDGITWNVTWLDDQAGWLEGSAFPSWSGNSVLTSHVYLANGQPGPFVNLGTMEYGDQVIVHTYGQKHIFKVETNTVVDPTDQSVMKHEEVPWLTLVTCKDYDPETDTYKKRVVVRAIWVESIWE